VIEALRQKLRTEGSPRHVPDEFQIVAAIPHTKTGKKLEVPIKRILQGARAEEVLSAGAIDRPELIADYVTLAEQWDAEDARAPKEKQETQGERDGRKPGGQGRVRPARLPREAGRPR
jgi:acetoacetyl-CoA synthetase